MVQNAGKITARRGNNNRRKKEREREREQRRERNTKFNCKRQKSRRMDFSRPIERGDGDCAVFIPFVREGLFVTKWNGGRRRGWKIKKRKKKGKKGVEIARVSFHIFETKDGLFLANEFESRNVSGRRIHLFRASSSNRKHKHLFTLGPRLVDEDD